MAWNSTTTTYSSPPTSNFSSTFRVEDSHAAIDTILLYLKASGVSKDSKYGLISDDVIQYIYTINLSIICTTCCVFGVVTNIISIVIFWRLGFQETVNIALMGLSISDFFSVLSLLWVGICYNPWFMYSDLPILTIEIQHKTVGWTHIIFTRVTAFLTVYITLERCLCIAFPFKIKTLLTPQRVAVIIVMIYVVIIGSMSQNYFSFRFVWKFVSSQNRTMLGLTSTSNRHNIQTVTYYLNVLYPLLSLTGVVTCSGILIIKLNQRSKWLKTANSAQESTRMSKDRQVVKLIVSVATIFICSFTPSIIFFLVITVEPELNVGRRYENLFKILISTMFILEALNSSVNIFVYYKMSSKYKMHFRMLFFGDKEKSTRSTP